MKIIWKDKIECGVVGTKTDLRLANGSKLNVGDIVEVIGKTMIKYHAIVVVDPSTDKPVLWGFARTDFDDLKSRYRIKKVIDFDKVSGHEKCIVSLSLKLVN